MMSRRTEQSLNAHMRRTRRRWKWQQWEHWFDENVATITLLVCAIGLVGLVWLVKSSMENDRLIQEINRAAENARRPITQYYEQAVPFQSGQTRDLVDRDIAEFLARKRR